MDAIAGDVDASIISRGSLSIYVCDRGVNFVSVEHGFPTPGDSWYLAPIPMISR